MIWKIIHPEYPNDLSYIMGTMHTRDRFAYTYYPMAKVLLLSVQRFWGEMKIDEHPGTELLTPYFEELPQSKILSAKRNNRLRKHYSLSEEQLKLPYFQLINILHEKIIHPEFPYPLDMALQITAKNNGIPVFGLESYQEQLQYYQHLIKETDEKELLKLSKNIKKTIDSIKQISSYYANHDIIRLHRLSRKQLGKHRQIMLNHRNQLMAQRILNFDFSHTHFIAIGAAHLWGGKGVLRYLKKGGLRLKSIH